jgi:hypothetical protein
MAKGNVGSNASTLSNTPPCPGNNPLLSLTPALRFTNDSIKSPATLIVDMNTDAISNNQLLLFPNSLKRLGTYTPQ